MTTGSRRSYGEGTITKRADGRWEARLTLEGGKRKCFYGKTQKGVRERLLEARHDLKSGLPVLNEQQTVKQFLESWIDTVQMQIRPSSHRRYSDYVCKHLVPGIGAFPLAKLTPHHAEALHSQKLREGLSPTTVHHMHGVLRRALEDAVRKGLVQRNVAKLAYTPRRNHREISALSEEQAKRFLGVVAGDRFEALYVLALTTGMRIGELLALRWQDLDLDVGQLQVRMNVQETKHGFVLAEPKTAHSRRTVGLTEIVIEALRHHRVLQAAERMRLGSVWDSRLDLVFPNSLGGLMIPDNLTKRSFKRYLRLAGLPQETRFHDLRHTAATVLLSRGVNVKTVSEMLGHADISTTLRVYAHVTPHMQAAAVSTMDAIFSTRGASVREEAR